MANAGTNVTSGLQSKALAKLDRGGAAGVSGAKSITGRSVGSRGTRRTGTMSRVGSRKSKAENDIADMEIEEIEGIIETKEKEMRDINKEKNKIQRSKGMNQGAKDTKMKPLNEALEELKQQMVLCYQIKEAKIPSYEKIPKDHVYYKHYMQKLEYMKMKNEASSKAADNRYMFEQA